MQVSKSAYHDLANAIVLQAVSDYRDALNGKSYHKHLSPEHIIKDIEKFFRSSYFEVLTKVKGEYLIYKLNQEHLEQERSKSCESN